MAHKSNADFIADMMEMFKVEDAERTTDSQISDLAPFLYAPHPKLKGVIEQLEAFAKGDVDLTQKQSGDLLEVAAALCFAGLNGGVTPINARSADAQFDLLQFDSLDKRWFVALWVLGFASERRLFLGECKCYGPTKESLKKRKPDGPKVGQREYARLAGLMLTSTMDAAGMGVMFSIWGESGAGYEQAVGDARLFRLLFLARHKRPIIDITAKDMRDWCLQKGGFVRLLLGKKNELAALSGIEFVTVEAVEQVKKLPKHLRDALK